MGQLEQYLDQVCNGIGGPRSLRQHIRQELREHLLDAAAQYRASGISADEALNRALEDFGGPQQVRAELQAMHGHRMMAVVIEKAIQWKEQTMKAKWLWTSWAHAALGAIIVMQIVFLVFSALFIFPKHQLFIREGWLGNERGEPGIGWVPSFIHTLFLAGKYWIFWLLPLLLVWILFEWRVRSENKPFIRLSAMGMSAAGLMVAIFFTTAAMVIPVTVGLPTLIARNPEPLVATQTSNISESVAKLEQAFAMKDWGSTANYANQAAYSMGALAHMGASAPTLISLKDQSKIEEVRAQLKAATNSLREAQTASFEQDPVKLKSALDKFHEAYGRVPRQ